MYRNLSPEALLQTAEKLLNRVSERFPDRGIAQVCGEVVDITREAKERAAKISQPNWWLRVGIIFLIFLISIVIVSALSSLRVETQQTLHLIELLEILDAGINDLLLIGAALFFLITFENRIKRNRALKALHEVRSLAHVIDMHQLTKDPERVIQSTWDATLSSPTDIMSSFELIRYLDYCSEMLSILGKVAALYVQNFDDEVALGAVNEIETLASGLSRKIWQKIMIIRGIHTDIDLAQ